MVNPVRPLALWLIRAYQAAVSPFLGKNCRFLPTCSQYALEAIDRFGVLKGCGLALIRLSKCGPWHPGGYDPVPPPDGDAVRIKRGE